MGKKIDITHEAELGKTPIEIYKYLQSKADECLKEGENGMVFLNFNGVDLLLDFKSNEVVVYS